MNNTADRYLLSISVLKERYLFVRSIDVAHYLGLSKPTVSVALKQLREDGLVESEKDGNLRFTASGKERVDLLNTRVSFFRKLFVDAGIDPAQAVQDAVSISWEMSDSAYRAFCSLKAPPDR